MRQALYAEVAEIIAQEYSSELVLEDIARRVASSRRQLQRAFDEVGHTSFRTYLTNYRMDRAAELLADTGLPVREVADAVGYRQPAQFAKAFRRRHGCSPSEFRTLPRDRAAGDPPNLVALPQSQPAADRGTLRPCLKVSDSGSATPRAAMR